MIHIQHIKKSFKNKQGDHFIALDDISLSINKGEIFAIIGSSGAGKSTLLRCMNLLERPDSGSITISNQNLTTLSNAKLQLQRQKISMIFQHFNLVNNKSVFENVALPLKLRADKDNLQQRVEQILKLVELSHKQDAYPNQLSGGQKQRVAIARALISVPDVLLCDEATSALDPKTTKEVLNLLKKINAEMNLTIVLVTHEMEVVRQICHRFAELETGKLKEVATLQEVLEKHPSSHILLEGLKPEIPAYIKQRLTNSQTPQAPHPLCEIIFYNDITQQAIISKIIQANNLEINILLANMDLFGNTTFGSLIVEVRGSEAKIKQGIEALKEYQLKVEVIGYVK